MSSIQLMAHLSAASEWLRNSDQAQITLGQPFIPPVVSVSLLYLAIFVLASDLRANLLIYFVVCVPVSG